MELKLIQHALAVGEELNFARAAERVHLSQPALSRSIQNLEAQLGFRLFIRDHHRVALSPQGRFFLPRARRLAEAAQQLQQDIRQLGNQPEPQVAFGCEAAHAPLLDPALAAIVRHEATLRLHLCHGKSEQLLRLLDNGEIEFFITGSSAAIADSRLRCTALAHAGVALHCRAGHPLRRTPSQTLAQILLYGLASTPLADDARERVRQWLGIKGKAPLPLRFECDDPRLLANLVRHSDLILLGTQASDSGGLHQLEQPQPAIAWHRLLLVRLADCEPSPPAQRVMERLQAALMPPAR
jgi:DNA-binding transcriptional LysR family regulator